MAETAGMPSDSAGGGGWCSALMGFVNPGEYHSVKFVRVKSRSLGSVHRLIFVACLAYVVGYQIILCKGYQQSDELSAAPNIKIKGVAVASSGRVLDAVDLVQPPLEESAVFVRTNAWETRAQRRGYCSGVDASDQPAPPAQASERCQCPSVTAAAEDCSCAAGLRTANGVLTGRCLDTNGANATSRRISVTGLGLMCEVRAWCPIEMEGGGGGTSDGALPSVGDFTLFARVDGRFAQLAPDRTFSNYDAGKLVWNDNLFFLGDLVAAAATGQALVTGDVMLPDGNTLAPPPARLPKEHFERIVERGAEIVVDYSWVCDLDTSSRNDCSTKLRVHRIDEGKGFNYRSASEYVDADTNEWSRDLTKQYGVRIVFRVVGRGGKFDPVTLGLVLGSGLGLLGLATVVTDLLLLMCSRRPRMRVYQHAKFEDLDEEHDHDDSANRLADDSQADAHVAATLQQAEAEAGADDGVNGVRQPLLR